jgi:hypothetical protein
VSLDSVDLYGYHILDVPNDEGGRDCLRWQRVNGIPRERRYVRVAGVAPDIDVVPFVDCIDTLLRGVLERVFLVKDGPGFSRPPRPKAGVFSRRLAAVWNELAPLLPSTAPVSHGQFVQDCRGCKRKRYQRALDEKRAGRFNLEEDARLAVFVKFEKTDRTTKSDPVPRIISPRGYRYNLSGTHKGIVWPPLMVTPPTPAIVEVYPESLLIIRNPTENLYVSSGITPASLEIQTQLRACVECHVHTFEGLCSHQPN